MATRHELELEKLRARSKTIGQFVDLAKLTLQLGAALFFCWMLFQWLQSLGAVEPERLREIARVIRSMKVGDWLPWVLSGALGIGYGYERIGKKRATKKLGHERHTVEQGDAYHAGSGLDEEGNTPKRKVNQE